LAGHTTSVSAISVFRDTLAASAEDGDIRIWRLGTKELICNYVLNSRQFDTRGLQTSPAVTAVLMLPSGLCLVGQADGVVRLWQQDGSRSEEIIRDTKTGRGSISAMCLRGGILYLATHSGVLHRCPVTKAIEKIARVPAPRAVREHRVVETIKRSIAANIEADPNCTAASSPVCHQDN